MGIVIKIFKSLILKDLELIIESLYLQRSSIEHGGTGTFSNIMALLTFFNEAPKHKDIAPLAL